MCGVVETASHSTVQRQPASRGALAAQRQRVGCKAHADGSAARTASERQLQQTCTVPRTFSLLGTREPYGQATDGDQVVRDESGTIPAVPRAEPARKPSQAELTELEPPHGAKTDLALTRARDPRAGSVLA